MKHHDTQCHTMKPSPVMVALLSLARWSASIARISGKFALAEVVEGFSHAKHIGFMSSWDGGASDSQGAWLHWLQAVGLKARPGQASQAGFSNTRGTIPNVRCMLFLRGALKM